jgi:hypothetical protein
MEGEPALPGDSTMSSHRTRSPIIPADIIDRQQTAAKEGQRMAEKLAAAQRERDRLVAASNRVEALGQGYELEQKTDCLPAWVKAMVAYKALLGCWPNPDVSPVGSECQPDDWRAGACIFLASDTDPDGAVAELTALMATNPDFAMLVARRIRHGIRRACERDWNPGLAAGMVVDVTADQTSHDSLEAEDRALARHSIDFRSVYWWGTKYVFTKNQAAVVKLLWEAWENDTREVGGDTLLTEADCETGRLDHIFDLGKHPAWRTMIRTGSRQGSYRLAPPHGK